MSTTEDPTERFREWMDDRRLRASDVCSSFYVSEQAVHNWRSAGIPKRRWAHVEKFMREWVDPAAPKEDAAEALNVMRVPFADDEMDDVAAAAAIVMTPIREFIRKSAVHQARVKLKCCHRQRKERS